MCYAIMSTPHVMCSVIVVLPSLAKVHECNLIVFTCLLSFFVLLAVLVIECSNNSLFFTSIVPFSQLDMLLLYPNTAV